MVLFECRDSSSRGENSMYDFHWLNLAMVSFMRHSLVEYIAWEFTHTSLWVKTHDQATMVV